MQGMEDSIILVPQLWWEWID